MFIGTDKLLKYVWRGYDHDRKDDADSVLSWMIFHALKERVVNIPDELLVPLRRLMELPPHVTEKRAG